MAKTAGAMFWFTIKPFLLLYGTVWFLAALGNGVGFSLPYFLKLIADYVLEVGADQFVFSEISYVFFILCSALVLQEVSFRLAHICSVISNMKTWERMNTHLFETLLDRPGAYFESAYTGQLSKRVDQVSTSSKFFIESFPWELTWVGMAAIVNCVLLFIASPYLGWVFVAWFVLFWVTGIPLLLKLYKASGELWDVSGKFSGKLVDVLGNVPIVHSFAAHKFEGHRFSQTVTTNKKALGKEGFWFIINKLHQGSMIIFLNGCLIAMSLYLFSQNSLAVSDFILVAAAIPALGAVFWYAGDMFMEILRSWSGLAEAVKDLQTDKESVPAGTGVLQASNQSISFADVSFVYPGTTPTVLSNFSLTIEPGQRVGIVGASGAGKSTLIKLLLRQYDADSGAITIGEQNIKDVTLESLRQSISFVPQDTTLFHRSLFENIQYARPDATLDEVIEVSKRAHTHDFIQSLPEQYDTLVGERGVKLSGGQRQRIAIARAMLKDAPILVLDEATSALDGESEAVVQAGFRELFAGRTVIAVAHRLSTLREMDRIVVIEEGQIVEDGTPSELLERENGVFKQKWDQQKGGFVS